jgi:hypothetical protein
MDTTGYSKGKKNFRVTKSTNAGMVKPDKVIARKDVPKKIAEFKKGATRKDVYKKKK